MFAAHACTGVLRASALSVAQRRIRRRWRDCYSEAQGEAQLWLCRTDRTGWAHSLHRGRFVSSMYGWSTRQTGGPAKLLRPPCLGPQRSRPTGSGPQRQCLSKSGTGPPRALHMHIAGMARGCARPGSADRERVNDNDEDERPLAGKRQTRERPANQASVGHTEEFHSRGCARLDVAGVTAAKAVRVRCKGCAFAVD